MHKRLSYLAVAGFLLLLAGCATSSSHMSAVPDNSRVTRPAPGKALVYFLRPSAYGGAVQATLYDGDRYIGTSSARTHIAYQATPGKHLFMVIGESADFMEADLRAGKTYYAVVQARMGVWKARFSLRPQNGQMAQAEVDGWVKTTTQSRPNDEGYKWAKENAASIKAKQDKYLPAWKGKGEKQILKASSGR